MKQIRITKNNLKTTLVPVLPNTKPRNLLRNSAYVLSSLKQDCFFVYFNYYAAAIHSNWKGHLEEPDLKIHSDHFLVTAILDLPWFCKWLRDPIAHGKEEATPPAERAFPLQRPAGTQELPLIVLRWCLFQSSLPQRKSHGGKSVGDNFQYEPVESSSGLAQ